MLQKYLISRPCTKNLACTTSRGPAPKAWIACVKTNVVTAVDISGPAVHDSYFFVPLVKRTAKHFDISEVSADKVP